MSNYYIKIPPKKKRKKQSSSLKPNTIQQPHTINNDNNETRTEISPKIPFFRNDHLGKKKTKGAKISAARIYNENAKKDNRKKGSKRRRIKIRENTPETFPPSPFPPPSFLPPHCVVNTGFGHPRADSYFEIALSTSGGRGWRTVSGRQAGAEGEIFSAKRRPPRRGCIHYSPYLGQFAQPSRGLEIPLPRSTNPPFFFSCRRPRARTTVFCPPTERGVAPFRSNGHWIFFIGLIEEGGGGGGWSWTRFRGIFALESFVSGIWRGEEETGGSVLEISLYEFVVRCCLFLCIINTKLKLSIIIIRNDRI